MIFNNPKLKMTAGSPALGFRNEFLLQLKCNLLVDGQDHAYSFRNARNREDAAQRLQRFFEETFHRRFAVLALMSAGSP
jgi:hypothetical protein